MMVGWVCVLTSPNSTSLSPSIVNLQYGGSGVDTVVPQQQMAQTFACPTDLLVSAIMWHVFKAIPTNYESELCCWFLGLVCDSSACAFVAEQCQHFRSYKPFSGNNCFLQIKTARLLANMLQVSLRMKSMDGRGQILPICWSVAGSHWISCGTDGPFIRQ